MHLSGDVEEEPGGGGGKGRLGLEDHVIGLDFYSKIGGSHC